MRTAVVLLILLAVAAVPGSLLPQRGVASDPAAVALFYRDNPDLAPWLDRLYLFDVYAAPWFAAVYLLLLVGLAAAERGASGAKIDSLPDALWYSIVTLTTVGYGDAYPVTPVGRAIGYTFVLGSLGVLGLLISRITEAFVNMRETRKMGLLGTNFTGYIVVIG